MKKKTYAVTIVRKITTVIHTEGKSREDARWKIQDYGVDLAVADFKPIQEDIITDIKSVKPVS